jgi:hypothetical protein
MVNTEKSLVMQAMANKPLANYLSDSSHVVYIKDRAGSFVFVNSAFNILFKLADGECIGKSAFDILPKSVADVIVANEDTVRQSGKLRESKDCTPDANGKLQDWHCFRFPVQTTDGRVLLCGVAVKAQDAQGIEATRGELTSKLSHSTGH